MQKPKPSWQTTRAGHLKPPLRAGVPWRSKFQKETVRRPSDARLSRPASEVSLIRVSFSHQTDLFPYFVSFLLAGFAGSGKLVAVVFEGVVNDTMLRRDC